MRALEQADILMRALPACLVSTALLGLMLGVSRAASRNAAVRHVGLATAFVVILLLPLFLQWFPPVVRYSVDAVVRDVAGISHGFFSTIHAYTNTQSLTDQPMADRRDSWAATENVIPSSSGAARALQFIWPDLKITGKAYRVPVRTGSIAELNLVTERPTSVEAINDAFRQAASGSLKGVMGVLEDEWASSRIIGDPHSSIVDLPLTQVMEGTLLSVAAWYDNEWGYAARLAETAAFLAG